MWLVCRIAEPDSPILASTLPHLRGTHSCMIHCPEDGDELPAGHLALNKGERKVRDCYTFPANCYSDKPLLLLEVGIGMGKKE